MPSLKIRRFLLAMVWWMPACGAAAKMAVREPVASQCASAGLKSCPELADAVLEYVDGDKVAAEKKLRDAAKGNSPEQLKRFASALEPLAGTVGGDAGGALRSIAVLLLSAGGEEPASASSKSSPPPKPNIDSDLHASAPRPAPNVDLDALRTGMMRPASDPKAIACEGPFATDGAKCKKARVFVGPLIVTNIYASGGCSDELFVLAGRSDKPHWVLASLPNASMNIHGQFVVEDGEELFIGARSEKTTPKDDPKCTLVWSGFLPATGR